MFIVGGVFASSYRLQLAVELVVHADLNCNVCRLRGVVSSGSGQSGSLSKV